MRQEPGIHRGPVHEFGQIDAGVGLLGVFVGQDPAVVELPAKGIWDDYDNALWGLSGGGFGDVGREAVNGFFAAGGGAFVEGAGCAVSTCHDGVE